MATPRDALRSTTSEPLRVWRRTSLTSSRSGATTSSGFSQGELDGFRRLGKKARYHHQVQGEGQGVLEGLLVEDTGVGPQLQHAPQNRHPWASALYGTQQLQGRFEALGIGVVAVHQEGETP